MIYVWRILGYGALLGIRVDGESCGTRDEYLIILSTRNEYLIIILKAASYALIIISNNVFFVFFWCV